MVCGERCYKTSWKLLIVEKFTLEARDVDKVKVKEARSLLEWTPKRGRGGRLETLFIGLGRGKIGTEWSGD